MLRFIKRTYRRFRLTKEQLFELKLTQSIQLVQDLNKEQIGGLWFLINHDCNIVIMNRFVSDSLPIAVIQYDKEGVSSEILFNDSIILNIYSAKLKKTLAKLTGVKFYIETPIYLDIQAKTVMYGKEALASIKSNPLK